MIAKKHSFHSLSAAVFSIIGLLTLCAMTTGAIYLSVEIRSIGDKIYPRVLINGLDFGNKTKDYVDSYFEKENDRLKPFEIAGRYNQNEIATFSATMLKLRYDSRGIADRAYLVGRSPHTPSRLYQQIITIFDLSRFSFTPHLEYDKTPVQEFLQEAEGRYAKPAQNALFKFENGKVVSFRQEEKGLTFLNEQFINDFEKAVRDLETAPGRKIITLADKVIEPEIILSEANSFGIESLIAVGKSDYTHSIPQRVHNILLAASKFNGILIPKGKTLSFNERVGDISSSTGYQPAYVIKNGKTVLGDGGGVCQVSTTLFRAALNAGLAIEERIAHAYRVGYYENDSKPGFDATVFAPYADLKIVNDSPASILIETEVDEEHNLLYFRLYGKNDGR
ncbi:VanW family protein, partial [Candidatus Roizmanbacteria bacterium]|nr:VanW family protein [Candidatus Roizmanbacteria bacterium]